MNSELNRKHHGLLLAAVLAAVLSLGAISPPAEASGRPDRDLISPRSDKSPVVAQRVLPPRARHERARVCGRTGYWRPGRWEWRGRKWRWWAGRCMPRPKAFHRPGCAWVPGHWKRRADGRVVWKAGRFRCGAAPIAPVVGPRILPPKLRHERPRRCGRLAYWLPGRWQWKHGRWNWRPGKCTSRPAAYHRPNCTWVPGHWARRAGGQVVWTAGRFRCGPAPAVVVADPTVMPPKPRYERPGRCGRASYWLPGRWQWRHGRWNWNPGHCKARPARYGRAGCRWVPGHWKRGPGRRVKWTGGQWRCR